MNVVGPAITAHSINGNTCTENLQKHTHTYTPFGLIDDCTVVFCHLWHYLCPSSSSEAPLLCWEVQCKNSHSGIDKFLWHATMFGIMEHHHHQQQQQQQLLCDLKMQTLNMKCKGILLPSSKHKLMNSKLECYELIVKYEVLSESEDIRVF